MTVSISASVGFQGVNRSEDVRAVQAGLKEAARLTLDAALDPGPVDGFSGVGTEGAIERFQRRLGQRRPDVIFDPAGNTLRRLNALLAIDNVTITYPFSRRSDRLFFGMGAGMRAFGARRSGGARAHAGIDLYFPDFTDILAIADGVVTRGPAPFFKQTFAIEVDHGPFLARYTEIAGDASPVVREGDTVSRGQRIGRVGILTNDDGSRFNVPSMMLHLEMYDKTETGRLTRAEGTSARNEHGIPYRRRRDLVDPTGFIERADLPVLN